jgi:Tfp pilus assembly protein PilP
MKKNVVLLFSIGLLLWSLQPLAAQEEEQEPLAKPPEEIFEKQAPTYDSEGRRDPFKDLLSGSEVDERRDEGVASYMIEDIVLIGIVKIKSKYIAIINGPQGFPYQIKVGDKFANGFVLTIDDAKVVFRQTVDRGVPLTRPRDITKEINPEER